MAVAIKKAKRLRSPIHAKNQTLGHVHVISSASTTGNSKKHSHTSKISPKKSGSLKDMAVRLPPSQSENSHHGAASPLTTTRGKFKGKVKKGEVRNPHGRPVGSKSRTMPDYRKMKANVVEIFMSSRAPAIIKAMLNMQLPAGLVPGNPGVKITLEQDIANRHLLLKNFKWAADFCKALVPKELGIYGQFKGEMTLTGLVKRATVSQKSKRVIDMVAKMNEQGLLEYSNPTTDDPIATIGTTQDNKDSKVAIQQGSNQGTSNQESSNDSYPEAEQGGA